MIPAEATHCFFEKGKTSYYQITEGPFDQITIEFWCEYSNKWVDSAYTSMEDFEDDGVELIPL